MSAEPRSAEDAVLDQQVKRLLKVEQRLYRSQNELGRQLRNMHELGRFALSCSSADDVPNILARAVNVLAAAFSVDWVAAFVLDLSSQVATLAGSTLPLPCEACDLTTDEVTDLQVAPALRFYHLPTEPEDVSLVGRVVKRCWPTEVAPPTSRPGRLIIVTVRVDADAPVAVVMAYSIEKQRAQYWPVDLSPDNLPFLRLFVSHVERALENSALSADLRTRGEELAASVDALKSTQAGLLQSQKLEAIGRLAGGVAHDFNNLLTVILGYSRMAADALPSWSPCRDDLEQVILAGERASAITKELLAFARRQLQHPEAVDLNELVGRTARMLARLIGEQIDLQLDLAPGMPSVWADPAHLEHAITNLVVNARDAMPDGGRLRISTRPGRPTDVDGDPLVALDGFVALEVRDTGVGMDEATKRHIFEPFFSTKDVGKGTGLGLAMVYGTVQQSGGRIAVTSAPGKGACFTLLLPRAQQTAAATVQLPPACEATGRFQGSALVVEDEPLVRRVLREHLEAAGFVVHDEADPAAALELVRATPHAVDLVFADVVLPKSSGVRLAESLWLVRPDLPIVFVSGYSRDHLRVSGSVVDPRVAAAPFVSKPFTRAGLLGAAAAALAHSRSAR